MTDIKRYKIEDGLLDFGIKGGLFVRDEDHAAIVAAKDARISEMNSIEQWCSQRTTSFDILNRKYIALQEQLSHYSMSAGQADQRKSESDAVRVAMGFSTNANDVSPSDLVDAIAALQEQVRGLAAEIHFNKLIISRVSAAVSVGRTGHAMSILGELGETPATDAFIREIRAQAVDETGDRLRLVITDFTESSHDIVEECACIAGEFAARIRSGEQP